MITGSRNLRNYYDVAVIGGGPVGSQVAYQLTLRGYRVIVLEKKPDFNSSICCTGIVGQECLDVYQIPASLVYRQVNGALIHSPAGTQISVHRDVPQAAFLNRNAFNRAWAERSEKAGAVYCYQTEATKINRRAEYLDIAVEKQRSQDTISARAVVLATGFQRRLIQEFGLGESRDFVMGAQTEVVTNGADTVEIFFGRETAPGFFGWLAPLTPKRALVGLLSRDQAPKFLRRLITQLQEEGRIAKEESPVSIGGVPLKPLRRTYDERLLVVGTAAGQVKPLTGGGIYFGLLCADIAAGTLHRAFSSGDFSGKKLSGYERAWKKKLGRELRIGHWARRVLDSLSDPQMDAVFRKLNDSGLLHEMERTPDLAFDWHAAVVSRAFNHKTLLKLLKTMKLPAMKNINN